MAETDKPTKVTDWTENDRISFTQRWNDANAFNLMRPNEGFAEYTTIRQRAYFYNWFDEIRELQGHEILWPGAAFIVATQMSQVENALKAVFISNAMKPLAKEGNKAIFDDVFARLAQVFMAGLKGQPLTGDAAKAWDAATLQREQFVIVQPIYDRHVRQTPALKKSLTDLAGGKGVYAMGGVAIGFGLDFKGDIMRAQDRYHHGLVVVPQFYKQFSAAITASRARRQLVRPDPSAGGRIVFKK